METELLTAFINLIFMALLKHINMLISFMTLSGYRFSKDASNQIIFLRICWLLAVHCCCLNTDALMPLTASLEEKSFSFTVAKMKNDSLVIIPPLYIITHCLYPGEFWMCRVWRRDLRMHIENYSILLPCGAESQIYRTSGSACVYCCLSPALLHHNSHWSVDCFFCAFHFYMCLFFL